MKVIVDRFEDKFAICETEERSMINIDRSKMPASAKEGDVLIIDRGIITIDTAATKDRKQEIEELMTDVWE